MSPLTLSPPPSFPGTSITGAAGLGSSLAPVATPGSGPDFASLLADAVNGVNANAQAADNLSTRALLGEDVTQAEVFTAVKKADLSLRMMISVRNKLLEGWKELQSMQV
ncbi:flagellar hook-basal body complex protein FliE [Alienimonas chondri]|uniref:Flagellar hook-basal body complex protein FliE n=1 Tax=Alienimonas chondri TaxID=2681879 RepID=A0ABX1VFW4_9PLAN|nr:flagellar hook-basal body complex protein FliE [Alienimonas chondri]NNJ26997.1 Flagellar hook-basal body complex protein FliE [Alienimonas chondri]